MNSLNHKKGGALVIVLLISIALASVSALLVIKAQAQTERAKIVKEFLQSERQVVSDLSEFIFETQTTPFFIMGNSVMAPKYESKLPKNINLYQQDFRFGNSTFKVQDAGGVLHLIPFNRERISNYLTLKNWPTDQIRNFLDSFSDWVDKDDFTHLYGMESKDYRIEGFPFNNKLQSKEELSLLGNVERRYLDMIINDKNVILYNPGRDNYDYSPHELLALNIPINEVRRFSEARDNWLFREQNNPIDNYSTLYWIIEVSSSIGDSKSSRMLHLVRRFGDARPYIISKWYERKNR